MGICRKKNYTVIVMIGILFTAMLLIVLFSQNNLNFPMTTISTIPIVPLAGELSPAEYRAMETEMIKIFKEKG